jgi:membrane-associated phospholipid phosphatase
MLCQAALALSALTVTPPAIPLRAVPDSGAARAAFHAIRWYEVAVATAGTGLIIVADAPAQRFFQDHRTATTDDLASVFRPFGDAKVALATGAGITLLGLAFENHAVRTTGLRTLTGLAIGGVTAEAIKITLGRGRPNAGDGATSFRPFQTANDSLGVEARNSFPSGHAMTAFALATSLSDAIKRTPATIVLYTAATGTALSRLNDNRHWLSDVVGGALLGITSARLASGRWRVFGLRPPTPLLTPRSAGLVWSAPLRF